MVSGRVWQLPIAVHREEWCGEIKIDRAFNRKRRK
jgi:hypothetical protein